MNDYAGLTYKERIGRGIELLDREVPGWSDKIICEDLDLGDGNQCILGQVFADRKDEDADEDDEGYTIGIDALGLEGHEEIWSYGFLEDYWSDGREKPGNYDILTAAWKEALGCPGSAGAEE